MLVLLDLMPLYWFHIDAAEPPQVIAESIRSLVREVPGWGETFRRIWRRDQPPSPPFIGSIEYNAFKLRRDIRYRNSFLPIIRGRILPIDLGTRVNVIMHLHPFVALFMTFWLGAVGYGLIVDSSTSRLPLALMFLFGIVLIAGGFVPEALKAKRLLSAAIQSSGQISVNSHSIATVPGNWDNP
jgi:hypothetical protein